MSRLLEGGLGGLRASPLLLAFACLVSCQVGTDPRRAQELADLSSAIDAVRDAKNPRKPLFLDELRDISCVNFCGLKDRCVEAYALHLTALREIELARAATVSGAKIGAHQLLDAAESRLKAARVATTACAAAEGEARRGL